MKILVFRMSSLGDVILSTSFLETLPPEVKVDWVIASEFEFVLKGHPRIRKLWVYQKKTGLKGWLNLVRELSSESFEVKVDLHRTLRTRIAFLAFFLSDLISGLSSRRVAISKERSRMISLLTFKAHTPKVILPTPYWKRFAKTAALIFNTPNAPLKKPSFIPLLEHSGISESEVLCDYQLKSKEYYGLMPASRWRTKEWSPESFLELVLKLQARGLMPVIFGRETWPESRRSTPLNFSPAQQRRSQLR